MSPRERLESLLARYVERQVAGSEPLDPIELCRDEPELLEPLRRLIRERETLAKHSDEGSPVEPSAEGWLAALRGRRGQAAATTLDPAAEPPPLAPGSILARRYRIRELLGFGGQGEVWRAEDLKLRVDVALKAVRADRAPAPRDRDRIRSEVTAAREVVSPNVCRIFDLVDADGHELVSMEYVDGQTLFELLRQRGPLALDEATEIAAQVLAGLEAIHAAGLVHRDVKPENVMRTRTGRVVVMDLGLAKAVAESGRGTIAGTPAYMAPEQAAGEAVDARADVFAAGVVLAELVDPRGIADRVSRQSLWEAVRQEPPALAETPWQPVLARALAKDPAARYASARELARALERVTLRVSGAEARPYPGLAAFGEQDAPFFFGREAEVEALWRKLDGPPRLLAVVGPSGAGKSSFLRAGVLAARPEGWSTILMTPGGAPFVALGQAIGERLARDARAAGRLVRFAEADVAVELVRQWREQGREALLVVDQLEELFTQNPEETQRGFAELLGRLPLEADVHVVVGLRDDFLLACHRHEALAPLFAELTPLEAPAGAALRRALTQPVAKCGFRFEDEGLVDEMLAEVEGERGALPLLAFAAASLWERRDRGAGLLTRTSYAAIGGVAGALAAHAEATLERIGNERLPLVRDLFRNLVTAEGTRASRGLEELVSVAPDRAGAREAVAALVDARLVTEYEAPGRTEGAPHEQRVEIIHESLLSAWPRLVRWRTQDADAAQLRDQLRQAAQVWADKGRPEDLLWTGTSFQEYSVWRARYPGRLTEVEQAFGRAMTELAGRQRRRQRWIAASIAGALTATAVTLALFWRASESARAESEMQARRAEASHLLALGRLELETHPSAALAFTLASLELADSPAARRFAVESLWEGPTEFALTGEPDPTALEFSPDGRWLAAGTKGGKVEIWTRDGGPPRILEGHAAQVSQVLFSARSEHLVSCAMDGSMRVFKLPGGEPVRSIELEGPSFCWLLEDGKRLAAVTALPESRAAAGVMPRVVRSWPLHGGPATLHGEIPGSLPFHVHAVGPWIVANEGGVIRLHHLSRLGSPGRVVAEHTSRIMGLTLDPSATMVAVRDDQVDGEVRIWSLTAARPTRIRSLAMSRPTGTLRFGPRGSMLSATGLVSWAFLWNLEGPPGAGPQVLRRGNTIQVYHAAFHPNGEWVATSDMSGVALWPLGSARPHVLGEIESPRVMGLALAPDDSWIAAGGPFPTRLLPMRPTPPGLQRDLAVPGAGRLAADPRGGRLLAGGGGPQGAPILLPLNGDEPRSLGGFKSQVWSVAFSRDGRLAAAGGGQMVPREGFVQVSDLETGAVRVLDAGDRRWVCDLEFLPDGRLLVASASGLRRWNLETGTFDTIRAAAGEYLLLAVDGTGRQAVSTELNLKAMSSGELRWDDLESGAHRALPHFGTAITAVAFAPRGAALVTANFGGAIRAGAVEGGEPHLLYGHRRFVWDLAVTSDGRSIVSAGDDGTVRIWPMPDVGRTPLHALPYDELLAKLRSLTNLRVVPDPASPTGYTTENGPFRGWSEPPAW